MMKAIDKEHFTYRDKPFVRRQTRHHTPCDDLEFPQKLNIMNITCVFKKLFLRNYGSLTGNAHDVHVLRGSPKPVGECSDGELMRAIIVIRCLSLASVEV
eukprot:5218907-Amphidinium_carterae.1